jgi:hypothetical protein
MLRAARWASAAARRHVAPRHPLAAAARAGRRESRVAGGGGPGGGKWQAGGVCGSGQRAEIWRRRVRAAVRAADRARRRRLAPLRRAVRGRVGRTLPQARECLLRHITRVDLLLLLLALLGRCARRSAAAAPGCRLGLDVAQAAARRVEASLSARRRVHMHMHMHMHMQCTHRSVSRGAQSGFGWLAAPRCLL